MAGKTLDLYDIITPDQLGVEIAQYWYEWNNLRHEKLERSREVRQYVFATDTKHTTNRKLPWSNTTTIPKLTQIRDNLYSNYLSALFPKRKWMDWEAFERTEDLGRKRNKIKNYIYNSVRQPTFKEQLERLVLDYIDDGNSFVIPDWIDHSTDTNAVFRPGYVGPVPRRVAPNDIVFNPIATSFSETPKIIRSLVTVGEAAETLNRMSATPEELEVAKQVFKYCMDLRANVAQFPPGDTLAYDESFKMDGFTSFRDYLTSSYVELLTFLGDAYDRHNDKFYKNAMIVVMDRHKILINKPYPYPLAEIPMYHSGWRIRQDNLWAMGPLDNLVGMQYRLDHVENLKADLEDLTAIPPMKVKGLVEEFDWGPMERIHLDADGDVELMNPSPDAFQYNIEIERYEQLMEAMAGSPRETLGIRTPGEKTAYEVQRLENAASRIFQNKINQFEEQILEPLLNSMLVLAQKNLSTATVRVINEEFGTETFDEISPEDISARGKIRPLAARHFAEKAERVQNLNNFFNSSLGQDPEIKLHFSSVKLAQIMEEILGIEEYETVIPYIRLSEQAQAQKLANSYQEQEATEATSPAGLTPDDRSENAP